VSTSSNQPSRLNTSVFILRWTSFLTSSTSSGVKTSSISSTSSIPLSISASSKITPKLSSSGFSDVVISSITLSLVILSLISGEMSSGFFNFFF